MSLAIYVIENKANKDIDSLCDTYLKRIKNNHKVALHKLPAARVKDPEAQKIKESASIESKVKAGDTLILCDELGKEFTSKQFAHYLEKEFSQLRGRVIFAIGGAYGFTDELKKKHNKKFVRLSVKGGGCAGFNYDWSFTDEEQREDIVIDDMLVVDRINEMYLTGMELD